MEEENKSMEWLEGQTLTIPVEVYINMRIELAELKEKCSDSLSKRWAMESQLDDMKKELQMERDVVKQYKVELEKRIGISELQKIKEMQDA